MINAEDFPSDAELARAVEEELIQRARGELIELGMLAVKGQDEQNNSNNS